MTGRRSARATSVQVHPTSIPKPNARQSQSPARRTTRSKSDNVRDIIAPKGGRTTRRGTREASVESNASAKSNPNRRPKKAARGVIHKPDLPVVSEEEDELTPDRSLENVKEHAEEEYSNESTTTLNIPPTQAQSPGGMSQMSGTTAVTSFSEAARRELDMGVADNFSEFYKLSCEIMKLLAPPGIDRTMLDTILKSVKSPQSEIAKELRENEDLFQSLRRDFGEDEYIKPNILLRALLGSNNGVGDFRPDAIIQAGNLAHLVKEFLVLEKGSQRMQSLLPMTDTFFPEPFVAGFDTTTRYGKSRLEDDSFNMALAIRTQYAILELTQFCVNSKDLRSIAPPKRILDNIFGEATNLQNPMRGGRANTSEQNDAIINRIEKFQSTFRQSEDALEQGDLVDLDRLEEYFPWFDFQLDLVVWSSSRLKEIQQSVTDQGGENNIQELLLETMRANDSQNQANSPPKPRKRVLGPPPKIVSGSARAIANLKRKRTSDTSAVLLNSRPSAPTSGRNTVNRRIGPSAVPEHATRREVENYQPDIGGDDASPSDPDDALLLGTAEESMKHWNSNVREKNKENLPVDEASRPAKRRRMIDPQPGARKLAWDDDSQESTNGRSESRPKFRRPIPVESEESEDDGFQEDKRAPNPRKRIRLPQRREARREPSVEIEQASASNSRQRNIEPQAVRQRNENHAARRRRDQQEARLRASARHVVDDSDDDDESVVAPPATAAIANNIARARTAMAKASRPAVARGRTKWSVADEEELVRMVEEYGCAWCVIERHAQFEVDRNQVQLKDKARNLKVNYIKANIELPFNFEQVTIGKKELAIIRKVIPEYEED